jgi:hypothetical protein
MKISNAANAGLLFALVFFAISLGGCSMKQEPPKLAEPIKIELDKIVANMACIPTGQFPYVVDQQHNPMCAYCEKLVDAGLLTKETDTNSSPSDSEQPMRASANVSYALTDIGQSAYIRGTSENTYGPDASRFCFGKPRVLQITRIFGPVMLSGQKNLGVRYIAQLDEPNPYVFDPRAKILDIPLPDPAMAGKPVLYSHQDVTVVMNPNNPNDFYLDTKLKIGPLGEK